MLIYGFGEVLKFVGIGVDDGLDLFLCLWLDEDWGESG